MAKNKGRKHDTYVRLAAWLFWQRRCGDFQLPKGVAAVKSKAALPLLKDIARSLDVPGGQRLDSKVSWLRLWLGRKIADPELDFGANASGAGGATSKHPFPAVTASAEKKLLKLLRKMKTKSTARALAAFNKEKQPHQRRLESKVTVRYIAKPSRLRVSALASRLCNYANTTHCIISSYVAKLGSPGRGKGTRALIHVYCYASTLYYHRVCLRIAL